MKNTLLGIVLSIVCISGFVFYSRQNVKPIRTTIPITGTPTPLQSPTAPHIMQNGRTYSYGIIKAAADRVSLIENLTSPIDSATAKDASDCTALTSAGFYTKEQTPLGLFSIGDRRISPKIKSTLVDGFITLSPEYALRISQNPGGEPHAFALQTGPLVWIQGRMRPLSMHTDEFARRIVGAVTVSGEFVLIALYDPEAVFSGPMLSEVPEIISSVNTEESLGITDAVNLDGGSASVFISTPLTLSELQPAGGFFCIK